MAELVVMTLAALATAGAAAMAALRRAGNTGGSDSTSDAPTVGEVYPPEPIVDRSVTPTGWGVELDTMRGSIPLDFLLRWMQRESGGNPCSLGRNDSVGIEAGIGQVFFSPPTQRLYGVTSADLRTYCDGQTQTRELTADERMQQAQSFVGMAGQYIVRAKQVTDKHDVYWSPTDDLLCLAKLNHALPILLGVYFDAAASQWQHITWNSYRGFLDGLSRDEALEIDRSGGYPVGSGGAPYWPFSRFCSNAQYAGRGTE